MATKLPKIFIDSGDPDEARRAKNLLGFLDGQTTNPSLVAKNPDVQKYIESGKKFTEEELLARYKEMIQSVEDVLPSGAISVETYADWDTKAADMLKQAEDMYTWGRNIYIKFPTLPEGLKAAHEFVKQGGRINMTLVFDQQQAAAVYAATLEAKQPNFVSPFVGRWDDRGYNGLDLIKNIVKMYKHFDKQRNAENAHVEVLSASIRTMDHFYASMVLGADILTVPFKILQQWMQEEKWIPDQHYRPKTDGLHALLYEEVPFNSDYTHYKVERIEGSLLDEGVGKFVSDWKKLLK